MSCLLKLNQPAAHLLLNGWSWSGPTSTNTVEPACKVSVLSNENWPYKRADLISGLLISIRVLWLGPAKNRPYKRVDLISADHTSGLDCTSINSRNEIRPCSLWTVYDLQLCICCCQLSCTLAPPLKLMSPSAVTKRDREYLREESIYYVHTRYSQNLWTSSICRCYGPRKNVQNPPIPFADVIYGSP